MKLHYNMAGRSRKEDSTSRFLARDDEDPDLVKGRHNYCLTTFIRRKLRTTQPHITINQLAVHEIDHLLKDVMQKIGEAAEDLLKTSERVTLSPYCMSKACKLALPKRLAKEGRDKGRMAFHKYKASFDKPGQRKQRRNWI